MYAHIHNYKMKHNIKPSKAIYTTINQIKRNFRKKAKRNKHDDMFDHKIGKCSMYYLHVRNIYFVYCKTCNVFTCVIDFNYSRLVSRLKMPRRLNPDITKYTWDILMNTYTLEPLHRRIKTLKKKSSVLKDKCEHITASLHPLHDSLIVSLSQLCNYILSYSYIDYINPSIKQEMCNTASNKHELNEHSKDILCILNKPNTYNYI